MPSNQRLDPLGIYGTRSAARQQSARRRRRLQQHLLLIFGAAGCVALWLFWRQAPTPSASVDWQQSLPLRLSAAPAFTAGGSLLLPTSSGQVRLVPSSSPPPTAPLATLAGPAVYASAAPLQSAPLVVEKTAFLPGQDGSLTAVNWRNRKALWTFASSTALTASPISVTLPANGAVPPRPMVVDGNDSGEVFALDPATGKPFWRLSLEAPVGQGIAKASLAVSGGRVPVVLVPIGIGLAARGGLVCIDARNGNIRWRFPRDGRDFAASMAPPAVQTAPDGAARRIFFATEDGQLYALDPLTGRYQPAAKESNLGWKASLAPLSDSPSGELISVRMAPSWLEATNLLVAGAVDGGLRAFDSESGHLQWTFRARGAIATKPRLVELATQPALMFADARNYAYALDPASGRQLRRWKLQGESPALWTDVAPGGRELLLLNGEACLQGIRL